MKKVIPIVDIESFRVLVDEDNSASRDYFVAGDRIINSMPYFPLRPGFYTLALTISGHVEICLDGINMIQKPGSLAIYSPFHVMDIIAISPDYSCKVLAFKEDFIGEEYGNINFPDRFSFLRYGAFPCIILQKKEVRLFNGYFKQLAAQINRKEAVFRDQIFRNIAINLLYETEHIYNRHYTTGSSATHSGKEKIRVDFMELLKTHFYAQHSVSFYASLLHITPKYLRMVLKQTVGKAPKEMIDEMILSEAKALLKRGRLSVNEIAETLHFTSIEEFSHFFKRKAGSSPTQYSH